MKRSVNPFDYAGHICQAMQKGILLTTKSGQNINTMTIGWGMVGIEWGKPVFVALVRECRHTKSMLDFSQEFTVNIPLDQAERKILAYCGTKSGRETNKILDMGLTLEAPISGSTPGIRQFPLTLECKVLYQQRQDLSAIPQDICKKYYPEFAETQDPTLISDCHTAYYAEIVNAYIIEE